MTQLVKRSDEMHGGGGHKILNMHSHGCLFSWSGFLATAHRDNSETWLMASL